jgi:hypothetical protein
MYDILFVSFYDLGLTSFILDIIVFSDWITIRAVPPGYVKPVFS